MPHTRIYTPHDAVFKHFLMHKATARDFMAIHLPERLRELCDLHTLQLESGSFIEENLREKCTDILYSVQTRNGAGYIYLLIEHQSSPDKNMAFRLMRYALSAMNRHLEKGEDELPLVIPLLFYHGLTSPYPYSRRWLDGFRDDELARSIYNGEFPLIDITVTPDEEIMQHRRMATLEFLHKHIRQRDMLDLVEQLVSLLQLGYTTQTQFRALTNYIMQSGSSTQPVIFLRELAEKTPHPQQKEKLMNIAKFLEQQGMQQGMQQGLQQGMQQGLEKGFQEGRQEEARRIAHAMLENGLEPSLIEKITGTSTQQLQQSGH
ncbi:Rpn family recombination-promoting nuclease/putative transposase [Superficieibacter sp.]|uniref:Rpn family recombination-promoting nuclease/putative transposase n=1 Tax=Superficieibacter sp. TaxID=2303322 RepID=UPI0028B06891|nr:Rpn family recombination-promoting nuclease/putative transposase [Superficieibacter sp.]